MRIAIPSYARRQDPDSGSQTFASASMSVADIALGYSAKHLPASAAADLSYRPISSLPLAAVRDRLRHPAGYPAGDHRGDRAAAGRGD
jgi:hypothetical protein